MSKVPATKTGTIARGEVLQLILDAPMPDNVDPRIYCAPRDSVEIVEVAPQRVTIKHVGESRAAAYMLVFATPGIAAFENFARGAAAMLKLWRAARKG